jgi:hypothetical protein
MLRLLRRTGNLGRYKFFRTWLLFYCTCYNETWICFSSCSLKWNFEVIHYKTWFRQLSISRLKVRWGAILSKFHHLHDRYICFLMCSCSREFSTSVWIRILLNIEKQLRETYRRPIGKTFLWISRLPRYATLCYDNASVWIRFLLKTEKQFGEISNRPLRKFFIVIFSDYSCCLM